MTRPVHRYTRLALLSALALGSILGLGAGCLDRPVAPATPHTTARVTIDVKLNNVDKIDLLFMIDNSASMADKQSVLAEAVPDLVNRLINPVCIDSNSDAGQPIATQPPMGQPCPSGSEPEFGAIADIHIGVVTSSLGSHGADLCNEMDRDNHDNGHLITRGGGATYQNLGFLAWDPAGTKNKPGGETSAANLVSSFKSLVTGAGQRGCGFESSLEAWYRFLIERDPPGSVTATGSNPAVLSGRDDALLTQRRQFLRPDSLVAIISLSDENDCSVEEGGQAYLSLASTHLISSGTSPCKSNPNDACCFNCGQKAPAGCPDPKSDPACAVPLNDDNDPIALRCFDQKRKFGVDFLYNVNRYIDGLTKPMIIDRMNNQVANPLFSDLQCTGNTGCKPPRDKGIVFFAGIAGVPWQDIAKDPKDLSQGYKTSADLGSVWPAILGDPTHSPPILPANPLMIEAIDPRQGTDPLTNEALAGVSAGPRANSSNGHEWATDQTSPQKRADLQYACVFDLPSTGQRDCTDPQFTDSCDCATGNQDAIRDPLCQDLNSGAYGTTQFRAKGYPGIRFLQVLKGIGDQAIVASICPANLSNNTRSDYGYRPAVAAIINKLKTALKGRCLPRTLEVDACRANDTYDKVDCVVLEALNPPSGMSCDQLCGSSGATRSRPNQQFITTDIAAAGSCVCQVNQLRGNDVTPCLETDKDDTTKTGGWCYVSPSQGVGTIGALGKCDTGQNIRFFGKDGQPLPGSRLFITCQEKGYDPTVNGGATTCDGGS